MALTKLTTDLNIISALGDSPNNPPDSLTATQMKAKFDEAGAEIKTYVNDTLTEEVDALVSDLETNKLNISYTQLYSNATGIANGATSITVTGISNYHLFNIEISSNEFSFLASMNSAKTRLTGIGHYLSGTTLKTIHLHATISGDVITVLNIRDITHTESSTHSTVGTNYNVLAIYGVV